LLTNAYNNCFKDYVLGDHLGHGQFATVRLARNKHSGEVFAIKIVSKVELSATAIILLWLSVKSRSDLDLTRKY